MSRCFTALIPSDHIMITDTGTFRNREIHFEPAGSINGTAGNQLLVEVNICVFIRREIPAKDGNAVATTPRTQREVYISRRRG